jgi:hypothetical protein
MERRIRMSLFTQSMSPHVNARCSPHLAPVWQLVRVAVHPSSQVTLMARPTDSSDPSFAPATGTNVAGFAYANFDWDTQADGY